jgi:hypothetical protein
MVELEREQAARATTADERVKIFSPRTPTDTAIASVLLAA